MTSHLTLSIKWWAKRVCQRNLDNNFLKKKSHCPQIAGYFCSRRCHRKRYSKKEMGSRKLAYVASVSVGFRSKERGTRVEDCAKNGASKRAGRGWGRKFPSFPSLSPLPSPPSPLFHFLALVSFLGRPNPAFLCSETKRKLLLRRLHVNVNRVLITFSKWSGGGSELSLPLLAGRR